MKSKQPRSKLKISKLKKDLWKLVSKYVRLKYSDSAGYCVCYTCGKKRYWKDHMQAGHGFAGRGNAILYELDIIRPQCFGCNICGGGKLDTFTYNLRTELGNKRFEELWRLKNTTRKFTKEELGGMIDNYKIKLEEFEK